MQNVNFPKIGGNKHRFTPLYEPRDFFGSKKIVFKGSTPKKVIFIYSRRINRIFARHLGYRRDPKFNKLFNTLGFSMSAMLENVLLVKLPIGGPLTAATADELIAIGIKEFLIMGDAGSLSAATPPASLVLCTKAVRDEGSSHHYIRNSKFARPSLSLTRELELSMKRKHIPFSKGPSWTIDAAYMETKEELEKYSNEGVLTVEMEAASLFAVAERRHASAAALFSVSDILKPDGWTGFVYEKNLARITYPKFVEVAKLFGALKIA